ncbi:MAG: outer membrane protein assembly factor [Candidatus Eisenbacteria bacterium]|nr:outer membrane protein assembly factor [Candidatus Eisenbacteria bacterium]
MLRLHPRATLAAMLLATLLSAASAARVLAYAPQPLGPIAEVQRDTLRFRPYDPATGRPADDDSMATQRAAAAFFDSTGHEPLVLPTTVRIDYDPEGEWLRAPVGDGLLDHPDPWNANHPRHSQDIGLALDYNRVDLVRYGLHYQAQRPQTMYPRLGARIEYATGRKRAQYGVQLEQPLLPTARFVFGVSMVRRTDHPELQQVDDAENSLALLLARTDYRDYWEREGSGVYLSWRVPDFSTVSVHARRDEYRSLDRASHVTSWFNKERDLRANPAIDDGESHSLLVRLERLAHKDHGTHAGLYHWMEFDRTGGELGGDFGYMRGLADVRSVLRLSPATSLTIRGVAGSTFEGTLPRQKRFALGGVDGLRAHAMGDLEGSQIAMAQAEYTLGLWALRGAGFEAGLHAIAFVDAGAAWDNPRGRWDVDKQKFTADGGFGVATSEDDIRLYVARDLADPGSPMVWSLRMQRPF